MSVLKRTEPPSTDACEFDDQLSHEIQKINIQSVAEGDIAVHRAPACAFLSVPSSRLTFRPFKLPTPSGWHLPASESHLKRPGRKSGRPCLGMTRKFKPIKLNNSFKSVDVNVVCDDEEGEENGEEEEQNDELAQKYEMDPCVLWEAEDGSHRVAVETLLGKYLREHQREGVRFLFECVCNLRQFEGQGCILADDMGLGKTLQSITLIYTMLRQGLEPGVPACKKIIVCTPTSLVRNWDKEIEKWLKDRVKCIALAESARKDVIRMIKQFRSSKVYQVLIISYDTFRIHSKLFEVDGICDMLICDEAHRLKNDQTLTSKALDALRTKRRILLSGTPMQNDLEEFYAMVNFCNPNLLGTVSQFRKKYQNPILIGREPDATENEMKRSEVVSNELSNIVNQFILRRTNSLLSKHLPPKLTQVVCVKMSELQVKLYQHILTSKSVKNVVKESDGISAQALSSINSLKKLCNHPQLVYKRPSMYTSNNLSKKQQAAQEVMETIAEFFPPGFGNTSRRAGARSAGPVGPSINDSNPHWSGKILLIANMLHILRTRTTDRIVLVSNYTQTLDVFSQLCRENNYPYVRLDGTTSAKKRQKLVDRLNDPSDDVFVFLLSSKAGGCGLNMIGANRLVLFDPDWNPATDKQAAARVWRDGQKKRTYVYRFVATGTIEEKIFQRQLSKEGLQGVVDEDQSLESALSMKDLKDLFRIQENTISDTHDKFKCKRCTSQHVGEHLAKVMGTSVEQDAAGGSASGNGDVPAKKSGGRGSRRRDILSATSGNIPVGVGAGKKPSNPFLGRRRGKFQTPKPKENVPPTMSANGGKTESKFVVCYNPPAEVDPEAPQVGFPAEGDLNEWSHHLGAESVDDFVLREAGQNLVSFVFGQAIDGESLALLAESKARALAMEDTTPKKLKTEGEKEEETASVKDEGSVKDEEMASVKDEEMASVKDEEMANVEDEGDGASQGDSDTMDVEPEGGEG